MLCDVVAVSPQTNVVRLVAENKSKSDVGARVSVSACTSLDTRGDCTTTAPLPRRQAKGPQPEAGPSRKPGGRRQKCNPLLAMALGIAAPHPRSPLAPVRQIRPLHDNDEPEDAPILRPSPRRDQIFELIQVKGHSVNEIADQLQISIKSVNEHLRILLTADKVERTRKRDRSGRVCMVYRAKVCRETEASGADAGSGAIVA